MDPVALVDPDHLMVDQEALVVEAVLVEPVILAVVVERVVQAVWEELVEDPEALVAMVVRLAQPKVEEL